MYTISLHGANFDKNPGVGEMMSMAAYRIDWRLWFVLGLLIQCSLYHWEEVTFHWIWMYMYIKQLDFEL